MEKGEEEKGTKRKKLSLQDQCQAQLVSILVQPCGVKSTAEGDLDSGTKSLCVSQSKNTSTVNLGLENDKGG